MNIGFPAIKKPRGVKAMQAELSAPELISTVAQKTPGWTQGVLQHANVEAGSISRLDIEPIGHGTL